MKTNGFWDQKKVLVTGGCGFVGSHLVEKLQESGARVTIFDHKSPKKEESLSRFQHSIPVIWGDCTNGNEAREACKSQEIVMNLAAQVGGIEYNRKHQGSMLAANLGISSTMLEAAKSAGVERFLVVSSACVYPHDAIVPTPEKEGFRGEPEPTNSGYGWAKRMAELLGTYYAEEFGMKIAIVRPYNTYGPRDHFDTNKSHVIPSLIRRVFENENPLTVWGSGMQTRAFLYVEDLVQGMMVSVEKYTEPLPINLGSDEEITIKALIELIVELSEKQINIQFDKTKPDGSPRRNSDNSFARKTLGFVPTVPLREGLHRTIVWYRDTIFSGQLKRSL